MPNEKLKILFIDVNCKNSSTGNIVYDLYQGCLLRGDDAAVCYGRGKKINERNVFKFGISLETYIHAFLTRLTGLTGMFSFFSTLRLIFFIKKFKPDVVHIHELHAYFVNIKQLMNFLKKEDIYTIWTFHCEFMYTGKCGHAYECEKWKERCGNCLALKSYPATMFWDFTRYMFLQKQKCFENYNCLTIITPSKWLSERVKMSFLNEKKIKVIHNGINQTIFKPSNFQELKEKHKLNNEKIILSVAPDLMSLNKGGELILQLASMFEDTNIKFIMIGIKNLDRTFPNNVIPLGNVSNGLLLAKYYSMADVFLICSKRENFPTTCMEALSCGTPVAGFNVGGIAETAPYGLGNFCEYGDLESLKDKIIEILNYSTDIKDKCLSYAQAHYSRNQMIDNYYKEYQLVKNRK